jgi:tetratricopeptide (TPR) repeat protein
LRVGWQELDPIWLTELARILPTLLVEQPGLPCPEPWNESWQRKLLFEAMARAVLAHRQPVLLVLDDLQWCDRETLEWLHYLLRFDPQAPLLIVGTVRPEEVYSEHPLTMLLLDLRSTQQVTELELQPLNLDETAVLAAQVAGRSLAPDAAQRLFGETEGNPLFVVETMRAGFSREVGAIRDEGGSSSLTPLSPPSFLPLPPKIHAVIQRRLAQLSPTARELASLASVIGRSFTYQVLAQASGLAEDALMRGLDELWQRRLVRELGAEAYDFSHDRIREVTQAAISQGQRRLLHRRTAQALESVYAADLDAVSGQLAGHYERAGLLEQAILYYQRAGEAAYRLYANEEAIHDWTKTLELIKALPSSPERMQQQIDVLLVLGPALIAARDYIAPEVAEVYDQAQALCRQAGDTARLFTALCGLTVTYSARGNVQASRELSEQCLMLAQEREEPALLMVAHTMLGEALWYLGEFSLSKVHLEQAINYYEPQQHASLTRLFGGQDPAINNLAALSKSLWFLGDIDQGLQRSQEVLARGQRAADPFNRALAFANVGMDHALRQEWKLALAYAEETITIATQWSIGAMLVWPLRGWALVKQDRIAEGIALIQQGQIELDIFTPIFRSALAEAYAQSGRVDEGLALIDELLLLAQRTGMVYWNAELYRLRGELLNMQGGDESSVEDCYVQAIQIARQQSAKSLELRAALSLARLWQRQGKHTQAHQLVSSIYGRFTEGFDTLDLQEARRLLDQVP